MFWVILSDDDDQARSSSLVPDFFSISKSLSNHHFTAEINNEKTSLHFQTLDYFLSVADSADAIPCGSPDCANDKCRSDKHGTRVCTKSAGKTFTGGGRSSTSHWRHPAANETL